MARLFRKEYHEHSNTWYFKQSLLPIEPNQLFCRKSRDEKGNYLFRFYTLPEYSGGLVLHVDITYDPREEVILSHSCTECKENDTCKHYLSVINYAYNYLTDDVLDEEVVQLYHGGILRYNEYWQRIILNSRILIADIYDPSSDKVRFYFQNYEDLDLRLIALITSGKDLTSEDSVAIEKASRQVEIFSDSELLLLRQLQSLKCSYSRKGSFFTIYKSSMTQVIPLLVGLQHKTYIKETGDRLQFSDTKLHINFRVSQQDPYNFIMRPILEEQLSAIFSGNTTWLFLRNVVYGIQLPFDPQVTQQLLTKGYPLKRSDLVYYYAVVSRQLALGHCYLDFDENIDLPTVHDNTPKLMFKLHKEGEQILLEGSLVYGEHLRIPMTLVRFMSELVRWEIDSQAMWFYIPPQVRIDVMRFAELLPRPKFHRIETDSQIVFEGQDNIEALKKAIFELTEADWDIEISEELRKEFVYKVPLQAVLQATAKENIDWFEYKVNYEYKDFRFTHEELKKFFKSRQKFMKLEDGRLVYFSNKDNFDEIEKILRRSESQKDQIYRLSSYHVPYLYHLCEENEGVRLQGDKYLETMYKSLLDRRLDNKDQVPSFLQPVMRSYQKAGYLWIKMLQRYRLGGILADEMGLGKTVQAISVLSNLPENALSIVVCPKTLLYNWAAEIEKFNRNLPYLIYEGGKEERLAMLDNIQAKVIIASYSIILNDLKELSKLHFNYIILDEAQHIKNVSAQRTRAIKHLNADHRLALTGTPMENDITELWSIFDFLMPGYLPTLNRFREEYANPEVQISKVQEQLSRTISPFILRRKKKDVLIELPDKQEQVAYCRMSTLQEKMYMQVLDDVRKSLFVDPTTEVVVDKVNYIHVLAALTRLRQICNHPAMIESDIHADPELSGKTDLLMELLGDALDSGRKILIFSQFVEMLKLLKGLLVERKIQFEYLDGETRNRQHHIDNFNNNTNIRVFLISLKTGGFGINLTSADTVILVDPWWNPMIENQAIDRTHRIGQTRKVQVYKLITKGSVEEKILNLQQNKRELFDMIIEDGQVALRSMDLTQIKELFTY